MTISVAARASPLSKAQAAEVWSEYPEITFIPHFVSTTGDQDLKTSLRTLDKTDFFTKEVDDLLLNGTARIAIHSAKDLPAEIPQGLKIVALTQGQDPSDSLVLREYDTLSTLRSQSVIATSSLRREEAVKSMRPDLAFRDLRGTIHQRLALLDTGEADGVVVAEAALIRLGLTHLNRIHIPGETTPHQGQLAILARADDVEMEALFAKLDVRKMKSALYLGAEYPLKAFRNRRIVHHPFIKTETRSDCPPLKDWAHFTHLLLTSKTAVKALASLLRKQRIPPKTMRNKTILAVGEATAELVRAFGASPLVPEEETAEGLARLLKSIPLDYAYLFWPHSSLSRPVIENALLEHNACYASCILYDTHPIDNLKPPSLAEFDEVLFSSPSTVSAFFAAIAEPPPHLALIPIGPITQAALKVACEIQAIAGKSKQTPILGEIHEPKT